MPFLEKTSSMAKSFDLFGIRPSVYYNGKLKSGTGFGFLLSVLLLTFTAICFGYFGQDLYYRLNPTMRYHEEYNAIPESITLDPEITPIVLELNSPFGDVYYKNPNIIKMTVSQLTIAKSSNETKVVFDDYPMEACRPDHFDKLDEKTRAYFLHKVLSDYFCIPKYLKNLTMQGAFDQNIFQTIKFTAYVCSNDSTGGQCLSSEEIKTQMGRGFIGIYFADYTINPGNYLEPKASQPKEIFTNFVLNSQKEIDIFLQNNYITTEDGVIFANTKVERVSNFISSVEFDFKTENPDFLMIYFKIKQGNAYYERGYRKLQDLLAQIGGFINCFWIIMITINYLYSNLSMISSVIVNVFSIRVFKDARSLAKKTTLLLSAKMEIKKEEQILSSKKQIEMTEQVFTKKVFDSENNLVVPSEKNMGNSERAPEFIELDLESAKKKEIESNNTENQLEQIQKKQNDNDADFVEIYSAFSTKKIAEIQKLHQIDEDMKDFECIDDLKMGFLDYMHYYTGCFKSPEREKKKMIINKGSKILRTCLDIKYIIQKFYEIEKLKQILLTEGDVEKFESLPKPELRVLADGNTRGTIVTNVFAKQVNIANDICESKEPLAKSTNMKKSKFSQSG